MKQATCAAEVFEQLYEEFMPKVYRYVHFKVNSVQLSEDLTSAVFEKALANFARYSADRASFSTWIFSIARNTVIDYYRTNGKRQNASLEAAATQASPDTASEDAVEKQEEQACLRGCVARLPAGDQEIVHLKFGAEMSNRQIAAMLGLSESNVGTKLYRAVRKLRDSFQESWNG